MKTVSIISGTIVLGTIGYFISRALKTNNTGNKTSVSITGVNFPTIQGSSLVLGVDIGLDNPTNSTLKLKKPYLTAIYNGNEVGHSIPSKEITTIKANDRTIIKGINLQIPFSNLGTLALSLFTGKIPKISVDVTMTTEANGIPYTDKKHFDL